MQDNIRIIFTWAFLSTGIFAVVGALYTWGAGWLFAEEDLIDFLLPMADLVVAAPLSFLAAWGLYQQKSWRLLLGMLACGTYLFGSVQVYIVVIWRGTPYPWELVLPPIFGIILVGSFSYWAYQQSIQKDGR